MVAAHPRHIVEAIDRQSDVLDAIFTWQVNKSHHVVAQGVDSAVQSLEESIARCSTAHDNRIKLQLPRANLASAHIGYRKSHNINKPKEYPHEQENHLIVLGAVFNHVVD